MKIDVKMPKLGESLTEGTVLKWWKKEGDPVKKDETLLEVSTDKVDSEIPSPVEGIIAEIVAQENETVEVDNLLARVETEDETAVQEASTKEAKETDDAAKPKKEEKQASKADAEESDSSDGSNLVDVKMPKLGESLTEGTIVKWWKQVGDQVKKDETLLEISTDKVDSEIPSPVEGVLAEISAQENETVEIDNLLARIKTAEAPVSEEKHEEPEKAQKERESKREEPSPEIPKDQRKVEIPRKKGGRFFSPLVRTIARKEGVSVNELERMEGSGRGGRVTKNDILNFIKSREKAPASAPAGEAAARPQEKRISYDKDRVNVVEMDTIRQQIAKHMRQSLDTSAHVYSVSECDMTRVLNIMNSMRPDFQKDEGFKLTITPFILHAVTKALLDFPRVNCSLDGNKIIEKKYINIGMAVAAEKGLIVPVIKNAEEKSFRGLARAVNDLVTRTRNNNLNLDDVQGSTFSVTNYGIFGNIIGLPIINQPNVAILGIGAIKKRPVVIEQPEGDTIGIRSMTYVSMSYDHRIVDGELGGRFMQRLVEYLENMEEDLR